MEQFLTIYTHGFAAFLGFGAAATLEQEYGQMEGVLASLMIALAWPLVAVYLIGSQLSKIQKRSKK